MKRRQHSLELQLLALVPVALTAFGLVMVYSATSASAALGNGNPVGYLERQGTYALIGLVLLFVAARTDFHALRAKMLLQLNRVVFETAGVIEQPV